MAHFNSRFTTEERFWLYAEKTPTCWLWKGSTLASGYGQFKVQGSRQGIRAHRYSWELHNGMQVPKDMFVLHSCDVRHCVNPSHLRTGTPKENTNDARIKGRLAFSERGGNTKLTDAQVLEIRELREAKIPLKVIGKMFHIHWSYASELCRGRKGKLRQLSVMVVPPFVPS